MKDNINKKRIAFNGIRSVYQLSITCEICGKDSTGDNVFASKYCAECAVKQNREKNRLRNIAYRERKKESGKT